MVAVRRIVPLLPVSNLADASASLTDLLGLTEVMNHGWIVTLADATGRQQLSLITEDATAPVNPVASIEVDDVDAAYSAALASGLPIVHDLCDEPWGVRRFFFRDASGNVINVLAHARSSSD